MADESYRPQGVGPHETLAGNMFDPRVEADGRMQKGAGVGGTAPAQVEKEGAEHIKDTQGISTGPLAGSSSSGPEAIHRDGTDHIKDTLADRPTGTEGQAGGSSMYGTMKSYLGFGNSQTTEQPLTSTTGSDPTYTSSAPGESFDKTTSAPPRNASLDPTRDGSGAGETGTGTVTDRSASRPDPANDGSTHQGAMDNEKKETAEKAEEKKPEEKKEEKKGGTTGGGAKQENKDSIPTAGGEKLGEKHWGESKMVPDKPKPQEEEKGVSSKEGQPTSEVKDNTHKNTGGATGGPQGQSQDESGEKPSMMDKMKDKLHVKK